MNTKAMTAILIFVVGALSSQAQGISRLEVLKKFEGTYQLVNKQTAAKPGSSEREFCYEHIAIEVSGDPANPIDLQILGLPLGQGQIVVQMTDVNKGPQSSVEENPMTGGADAILSSEAKAQGRRITYHQSNRDLKGTICYSTDFEGTLTGKNRFEFQVHSYRSINGFEDLTADCRYVRTQSTSQE